MDLINIAETLHIWFYKLTMRWMEGPWYFGLIVLFGWVFISYLGKKAIKQIKKDYNQK